MTPRPEFAAADIEGVLAVGCVAAGGAGRVAVNMGAVVAVATRFVTKVGAEQKREPRGRCTF
jgi:hypothetical protein